MVDGVAPEEFLNTNTPEDWQSVLRSSEGRQAPRSRP